MLIGYARISSDDPDLALQKEALKQAGCCRIYKEGGDSLEEDRPGLRMALDFIQEGDSFVVCKLDRPPQALPWYAHEQLPF